ncbi:MAG: hypothetical protein ACHBN1_09755 [Heteroscytonema crispum UTEX LB 1556]
MVKDSAISGELSGWYTDVGMNAIALDFFGNEPRRREGREGKK